MRHVDPGFIGVGPTPEDIAVLGRYDLELLEIFASYVHPSNANSYDPAAAHFSQAPCVFEEIPEPAVSNKVWGDEHDDQRSAFDRLSRSLWTIDAGRYVL